MRLHFIDDNSLPIVKSCLCWLRCNVCLGAPSQHLHGSDKLVWPGLLQSMPVASVAVRFIMKHLSKVSIKARCRTIMCHLEIRPLMCQTLVHGPRHEVDVAKLKLWKLTDFLPIEEVLQLASRRSKRLLEISLIEKLAAHKVRPKQHDKKKPNL